VKDGLSGIDGDGDGEGRGRFGAVCCEMVKAAYEEEKGDGGGA
jgi:hypothetical protein